VLLSRDNLVVLGILTVITITYFAVVYRIQSAAADDVSSQRIEIKRHIETDSEMASRVSPMMRQIEKMKQRYNDEDWGHRLPERQELAGFLHEIASGLSQEKLINQFIQPGNPSQTSLYNCLPITLRCEGNFLSLARFLKRIDGMTRLVRVERLAIELGEDTQKLQIEMGMNIYFTEQQTGSE
jgi:Tfp pilus assembly protein PilO